MNQTVSSQHLDGFDQGCQPRIPTVRIQSEWLNYVLRSVVSHSTGLSRKVLD